MHGVFTVIRACLFASLLALISASTWADLSGKIVKVSDGDTVHLLDDNGVKHTIRLTGIDAPERKQAYGQASRKHLNNLIAGKNVVVLSSKQDRYGRTVGKILMDGNDVNLHMVESGLAWWYRHYKKDQSASDRRVYEHAEDVARTTRVGLWRDSNPTPPRAFRRTR